MTVSHDTSHLQLVNPIDLPVPQLYARWYMLEVYFNIYSSSIEIDPFFCSCVENIRNKTHYRNKERGKYNAL